MSDFGLTPKGFKRKLYADIVNEMGKRAKELFGENINLSERSFFGLLIRLFSWFLSVVWMLAEKVYYSAYPDTAEGISLDRLGPYANIRRILASMATGIIEIIGTPNFFMQELIVSTRSGIFFRAENITIGSNGKVTVKVTAIESGISGNVDANEITEIVTPNPNIESVTNPERTTGGREKETDAEFRERFNVSAEGRGASTIAAIKRALVVVPGVRAASVAENNTNLTDSEGRPPKSFECYVLGGEPKDIAQAILDTKAAGIETHGQENEIIKDVSGVERLIKFTRATETQIHIRANVTTENTYQVSGDDELKTTFIQYIGGEDEDGTLYVGLNMGMSVIYARLISLAYKIEGVKDIDIEVSTDGTTWKRENVELTVDQVAQTSHLLIEVNHV